jgi:hypothetical protein
MHSCGNSHIVNLGIQNEMGVSKATWINGRLPKRRRPEMREVKVWLGDCLVVCFNGVYIFGM